MEEEIYSLDDEDLIKKQDKFYLDKYINAILNKKSESEDITRIDDFLKRNAGMNYEEFINYAKPEEIKENSYGLFKRKSIKRSLFKSKSKSYLEALCDLEENGEDIQKVLDDIRLEYIPTLKKDKGKEPTLELIYSILKD